MCRWTGKTWLFILPIQGTANGWYSLQTLPHHKLEYYLYLLWDKLSKAVGDSHCSIPPSRNHLYWANMASPTVYINNTAQQLVTPEHDITDQELLTIGSVVHYNWMKEKSGELIDCHCIPFKVNYLFWLQCWLTVYVTTMQKAFLIIETNQMSVYSAQLKITQHANVLLHFDHAWVTVFCTALMIKYVLYMCGLCIIKELV